MTAKHATFVVTALLLALVSASQARAGDLVLKRVLLSTGGVGYFEYEATVDGPGELGLTVRRDQVDDVLKSLVIYDDKGSVGSIELPGDQPLVDAFRELPFDQQALTDPMTLLNALRGAEVTVGAPKQLEGRILGVTLENRWLPNGGGLSQVHRLTLITKEGMQSLVLEEAEALKFTDAKLQAQVDAALAAEAANADKERRTLSLRVIGAGPRLVRVGYLEEVPLWKATYRLTLESGEAKTAALQGWAVVENRSGTDWNGVELTLVSGDPTTFRQALYATYYVKRPEVPVEVLGRILPPPPDNGSIAQAALAKAGVTIRGRAVADFQQSFAAGSAASVPAPAPAPEGQPEPTRFAEIAPAAASDAATQVSLRMPAPVSLRNGASMLLPVVVRAVPAQRLSLYQPAVDATHPLAAVDMTNGGDSALPPGILTLYERSSGGRVDYLGDARLAPLPEGEHRLLSFALDRKVKIDRTMNSAERMTKAQLADGVLELTTAEQQRIDYLIAVPPKEARHLVIEVPRPGDGWSLIEPEAKTAELTPAAWRLQRDIAAGQTLRFSVTLERPVVSRIELSSLTVQQIGYYQSSATFSEAQQKALARLRDLAAAEAGAERQRAALEAQQRDLIADQGRVRENLAAVPKGSDAERRYLTMLNDQEDRLAKLSTEIDEARHAQDVAKSQLADYIKGLKV